MSRPLFVGSYLQVAWWALLRCEYIAFAFSGNILIKPNRDGVPMFCKKIRNTLLRSRKTAESTRVSLVRPPAVFLVFPIEHGTPDSIW